MTEVYKTTKCYNREKYTVEIFYYKKSLSWWTFEEIHFLGGKKAAAGESESIYYW